MGYLVLFLVSIALSAALAPKTPEQKPVSLSELNIPTAEPGRAIPVAFGTVTIESPNIVWYGDLATRPVRTSSGK